MSPTNIENIAQAAEKVNKENERRSKFKNAIQSLLAERQQVLVSFCELAGLDVTKDDINDVLSSLNKLNQLLIDYSALGHFEIYNRIIEGKERREAVVQVAENVYADIEKSTQVFIAFNDKYDGADSDDSVFDLHEDLSAIGECMALRIDGEDRLIKELSATKAA